MTRQYRFGDFLIDESSFRLLRAGEPVAIEPKALNVLLFLVQNSGRLVERRELLTAVWGDAFVTDHVLNRSVGQLRKALGDDAKEPRYIETVPTLGYRFIADVGTETLETMQPDMTGQPPVTLPATKPTPAEASAPTPIPMSGSSRKLPWLVLTLSLLLAGTVGFWLHSHQLQAAAPIRSLAVMPLENLSPQAHEDYFADGMTDELITELAHIPNLRVVSRTSVMQEKGKHKPLSQIARELNVDAIMEGSVVQSGNRIRITAQLIDTRNDKHLWAESFEGPLDDILSLQDSVSRKILQQTSATLTPAVQTELTTAKHVDPAAYDAYLRGLYFTQRRDGALAVSYFQKALSIAPDYGAAHAGLAEALVTQVLADGALATQVTPSAVAAAKRAIALDPSNGEAYTALGAVDVSLLFDWGEAERNLRKGIELSPSSANALTWYAIYLTSVGSPSEAVEVMHRALMFDPLSFWANRLLGSVLYYSRRYDESLVALKRAQEIAPDKFEFVEGWNSGNYEMQGRYSDALAADLIDIASELSPGEIETLRSAFKTGGWKGYQQARVRFLLLRPDECHMNPLAMSYVRLGNLPEALHWFGRDLDNGCGRSAFDLSSDPRLDGLRSDPRFQALLHRINLPHRAGA